MRCRISGSGTDLKFHFYPENVVEEILCDGWQRNNHTNKRRILSSSVTAMRREGRSVTESVTFYRDSEAKDDVGRIDS